MEIQRPLEGSLVRDVRTSMKDCVLRIDTLKVTTISVTDMSSHYGVEERTSLLFLTCSHPFFFFSLDQRLIKFCKIGTEKVLQPKRSSVRFVIIFSLKTEFFVRP